MIEAKCKNNEIMQENNFSKKISYIDKSENLCYRVDFYDLNGQLYKIQYISNYQKQNNGKFFALKMVMENVKNGRKSILITDKIQTGSTFRENFFSPGNLEKQ
jgi:archaellum biogenesis ATPase FlaH